jgi:trimethylamine--corrinoid protein Co-methyltransferase
MGQYYRIPTWGYAGDANSCVVDEQASAEGTFSIMASLLAGNNLTHDVGYLESGLTFSPEMVVLCDEIISMLRRYMAGVSFDETSMAMEAIHEVGSDGNYLEHDHTLDNFRQLWRPSLFNRLGGKAWASAGSRRLGEVLREKTVSIMDSHKPEPLPGSVLDEIDFIMKGTG